MHEPVKSHLEDLLQGRLDAVSKSAVHTHLSGCPECTASLREMQLYSGIMRSLRAPALPDQSPGFYARVMQRVEEQGRPTFWSLFLDPVFGRRLVYATGALFLLMASFLLATSNPNQPELARTPIRYMAEPADTFSAAPPSVDEDLKQGREHFLVTMASFSGAE